MSTKKLIDKYESIDFYAKFPAPKERWPCDRKDVPRHQGEFVKYNGVDGRTHLYDPYRGTCECEEDICRHDVYSKRQEQLLLNLFYKDPSIFKLSNEDWWKVSDFDPFLVYINDIRTQLHIYVYFWIKTGRRNHIGLHLEPLWDVFWNTRYIDEE